MGYNGGVNKRGYYRRNNGMYKKSSYKSGERLIGNIIASGIGLLCSFSDLNIDSTQIEKQPPKEINIKKIKTKTIICNVIIFLCPIFTILTYEYANWRIFFAVFLWGIIEIVSSNFLTLGNDFCNKYKINLKDREITIKTIRHTHNISKIVLCISMILNTLPFLIDSLETKNDFTHESFTIFTTILIVFRIIWLSIIVKTIHNENKRLEDIIQNCISK